MVTKMPKRSTDHAGRFRRVGGRRRPSGAGGLYDRSIRYDGLCVFRESGGLRFRCELRLCVAPCQRRDSPGANDFATAFAIAASGC
jgi:hypothetical protein